MSATALLLLIVAIFILFNAPNFVEVIKGEAKLSFLGTGDRTKNSSNRLVAKPGQAPVAE